MGCQSNIASLTNLWVVSLVSDVIVTRQGIASIHNTPDTPDTPNTPNTP